MSPINEMCKFKGYRCFKDDWAGFDSIYPMNVIIGKNNTGKSCLLDLIKYIAIGLAKVNNNSVSFKIASKFTVSELKTQFRENTSGGDLGGRHWVDHGAYFVDEKAIIEFNGTGNCNGFVLSQQQVNLKVKLTQQRLARLEKVVQNKHHFLQGHNYRRILADRDIVPEKASTELTLTEKGLGATNIIRRFLNSSNSNLPRKVIQKNLLDALNKIFSGEATFSEIQVQEHDDTTEEGLAGAWEVFLGETNKGIIPLRKSGSGLKTIILMLLNLIVIPEIEKKPPKTYIFCFEELENNVHPSLLRKMLKFLEEYVLEHSCYLFITTHSNVALDFYGTSENAQIVHVTHDAQSAATSRIKSFFNQLDVLDDIGAKPSDLLQSNGIIWVEGPSDRIYINKWIDIYSNGELTEGRNYQCAFYGGSLLANYDFSSRNTNDPNLSNLLNINPNAILIADGDRTSMKGKGSKIKQRVSRIAKQIGELKHGFCWITKAKEIESYIPTPALEKHYEKKHLRPIGQYERFSYQNGERTTEMGYLQSVIKKKTFDKVKLAKQVVQLIDKNDIESLFDLDENMVKICNMIKQWNE